MINSYTVAIDKKEQRANISKNIKTFICSDKIYSDFIIFTLEFVSIIRCIVSTQKIQLQSLNRSYNDKV